MGDMRGRFQTGDRVRPRTEKARLRLRACGAPDPFYGHVVLTEFNLWVRDREGTDWLLHPEEIEHVD